MYIHTYIHTYVLVSACTTKNIVLFIYVRNTFMETQMFFFYFFLLCVFVYKLKRMDLHFNNHNHCIYAFLGIISVAPYTPSATLGITILFINRLINSNNLTFSCLCALRTRFYLFLLQLISHMLSRDHKTRSNRNCKLISALKGNKT